MHFMFTTAFPAVSMAPSQFWLQGVSKGKHKNNTVKTTDDCKLLQNDLDALEQWECTWQMHFQPDKCKLLRFTRAHHPIHHTYSLHNSDLKAVHTHLGIHLSTNLEFNTYIDHCQQNTGVPEDEFT